MERTAPSCYTWVMPKPHASIPVFLSAQDAAQVLGISVGMVRLLVLQGKLSPAATTKGRKWLLFDPKTVDQLARERKARGPR